MYTKKNYNEKVEWLMHQGHMEDFVFMLTTDNKQDITSKPWDIPLSTIIMFLLYIVFHLSGSTEILSPPRLLKALNDLEKTEKSS